MAFIDDEYYDGSRFFGWLSIRTGVPIDQINFVVTQLIALLLAPLFRNYLHPSKTKPEVRHAFGLIVGLQIGYFAFGRQAFHLGGLPGICYVVIRTQDPQSIQRTVLLVAMTYLSCLHLHRQVYDYGSHSLDVTGPLMVITQKVTSLAFSLHDGLTGKDEEMTRNQKYYAIRKLPSALEYFSYVFNFHVLMAGPVVFYRDYIEFITGQNFQWHRPTTDNHLDTNYNQMSVIIEPSPVRVVVKKFCTSVVCGLLFAKFISSFPIQRVKDDDFINNKTVVEQMLYLSVATVLVRFKYYHAWLLADAICNLSGLGFNGYASDGTARWDLVSNVDILRFEMGITLKDCIEHWNKGTNIWLRIVIFERVSTKYGTILTYALSAFWHGFYPGYYVTFASGALFTYAARAVRRCIRHFFQDPPALKAFYDFITMIVTRVVMTYITFSFILLEFWPTVRLYMNMYFSLHLAALSAIIILPFLTPHRPVSSVPLKNPFRGLSTTSITSGVNG